VTIVIEISFFDTINLILYDSSTITFNYVASYISIKMSDKDDENLESAQKNQRKIGQAESNPGTSGPAENLREEAAEMTDEGQDSKEPA
jgi:hypothetical protein